MPSPDLVNAYLGEIAKSYSVPWSPPRSTESSGEGNDTYGGAKVRDAS
jgi:vacuolar protein sorting-associated protein IST1